MRDDGTVGGATIRTTTTATSWASRMNRPTWLLTPDDLRNIRCVGVGGGVADPAAATAHRKPTGFPTDDVLASSPSSGRRGTGAFLPSVPMQNPPTSQPQQHRSLARPIGKAPPPNGTTNNNSVTKKKQRPSASASRSGGGPGMHVVFIDSSRPSGTGVFLPRSAGTDQLRQPQPPLQKKQQQQHHPSQDKKPPVGSAAVLLPTRVVHLLNQRIAKLEPAAEPPNQPSAVVLKEQGEQQGRHSLDWGDKRGNAGITPAADAAQLQYNDGDGDQRSHAPKCSVPLQTHTSSVLIETLLPEEWSY